ncbi:uncharacterized protein LOC114523699 [Dendronephthya gigantea]|uniref:uncharacterized protein LOC114523699 n=1 Tax=Dendronephthya gigantea TaxID=151771 RepID=UPI00106A934A|nr:uncharacterized protein LOC114523699 [Dendronephthya gigantea]
MTCGICSQETQLIVRENKECRDIGNVQFCARACHQKKSKHLKLYYARKYCRKTCGYCSRLKKKVENTCVDRPICKRLTTFYKIENCWRLPHTLRKRALRKCPKLCGLCSPITEKPPVPTTTLLNGVAAEKLKLTEAPRPPHPPVDDGESDERPRGGVFYIYTKYLSL